MINAAQSKYPYRVLKENIDSNHTELTDFFFRFGANLYVFTYDIDGQRKHTFIDSGYLEHRDRILPVLEQNQIDLRQIEKIIITHRHTDHCGLAGYLASISGARILAHANFKNFVNGDIEDRERIWLGKLDPTRFKDCDMEYLTPTTDLGIVCIEGVQFPRLRVPIPLGPAGKLEILACPEGNPTHSPDQLIVRYSHDGVANQNETGVNHSPSTADMLFSGDLWLMTGPIFERNFRVMPRMLKYAFLHFKERFAGRKIKWEDPRDQDAVAKEALKKGFSLIRVKPGHGDEFLGCRIIPNSLLADRDLLVKLGFSMDEDPAILKTKKEIGRITDLKETAYSKFKEELEFWLEMGAGTSTIAQRLQRISGEQKGGGSLVQIDRKQRRERLKETLTRLEQDSSASDQLRRITKATDR